MENKSKLDLFDAWRSGKNALSRGKESIDQADASSSSAAAPIPQQQPENPALTELAGNTFVAPDATVPRSQEQGAASDEVDNAKSDDEKTVTSAGEAATEDASAAQVTSTAQDSHPIEDVFAMEDVNASDDKSATQAASTAEDVPTIEDALVAQAPSTTQDSSATQAISGIQASCTTEAAHGTPSGQLGGDIAGQANEEVELPRPTRRQTRSTVDYNDPEFDAMAGAVHISEIHRSLLTACSPAAFGRDSNRGSAEDVANIAKTLKMLTANDRRPSGAPQPTDPSQPSTPPHSQPTTPRIGTEQPTASRPIPPRPVMAEPRIAYPSTFVPTASIIQPGSARRRIDLADITLPNIPQTDIAMPDTPETDAKKHMFTFGMNMRYITGDDVDFGKMKGLATLKNYEWTIAESGIPTVVESRGKQVYGLVYEVDHAEQATISLLDCAGHMAGCVVDLSGDPIRCMFFLNRRIGGTLPHDRRVLLVQAFNDALNHGMPADYVEECLQKVYSMTGSQGGSIAGRAAAAA
ncbi:hypothetical protein PVAG01_10207 [Phlyctema vagabunda]|uniref:Gamma-glutamylcyclotransferase n=1 Tax=Phlyctema vagabunda TaxID=108571 RepID=A0ABR4P5W4_9HELO